jgi:hypothetical protein
MAQIARLAELSKERTAFHSLQVQAKGVQVSQSPVASTAQATADSITVPMVTFPRTQVLQLVSLQMLPVQSSEGRQVVRSMVVRWSESSALPPQNSV